jgi:hypothetical protein
MVKDCSIVGTGFIPYGHWGFICPLASSRAESQATQNVNLACDIGQVTLNTFDCLILWMRHKTKILCTGAEASKSKRCVICCGLSFSKNNWRRNNWAYTKTLTMSSRPTCVLCYSVKLRTLPQDTSLRERVPSRPTWDIVSLRQTTDFTPGYIWTHDLLHIGLQHKPLHHKSASKAAIYHIWTRRKNPYLL